MRKILKLFLCLLTLSIVIPTTLSICQAKDLHSDFIKRIPGNNHTVLVESQEIDGDYVFDKTVYTLSEDGKITKEEKYAYSFITEQVEKTTVYEYSYDENGNCTSILTDYLDADYVSVTEYTYDSKGNVLTESLSFLDDGATEYDPVYKVFNTYDNNNNLISSEKQIFDDNTWVNDSKNIYSYNDKNLEVECIEYEWNTSSSTYVYSAKSVNEYNENGLCIKINDYEWNNDAWKDDHQMVYTFNAKGGLIKYESYQPFTDGLKLNAYSTYELDDQNRITLETSYTRDYMTGDLVEYAKYETTYDGNACITKDFAKVSNVWVLTDMEKKVETKDEYGNIVEIKEFSRVTEEDEWEESSSITYKFKYLGHIYENGKCIFCNDKLPSNEPKKTTNKTLIIVLPIVVTVIVLGCVCFFVLKKKNNK